MEGIATSSPTLSIKILTKREKRRNITGEKIYITSEVLVKTSKVSFEDEAPDFVDGRC
jgi:hypothetical protein